MHNSPLPRIEQSSEKANVQGGYKSENDSTRKLKFDPPQSGFTPEIRHRNNFMPLPIRMRRGRHLPPRKSHTETDAYRAQSYRSITPQITRTATSAPIREWCGITVWVLVIPVPLKLPVCHSYSEQSFGSDEFGRETVLLNTKQAVPSPLYACGPLMVLGPIVHGYEGNALCGVFPD